jgi:hypothetical protein
MLSNQDHKFNPNPSEIPFFKQKNSLLPAAEPPRFKNLGNPLDPKYPDQYNFEPFSAISNLQPLCILPAVTETKVYEAQGDNMNDMAESSPGDGEPYYREMKIIYLKVWSNCLSTFLNWPQEEIDKITDYWRDWLEGNLFRQMPMLDGHDDGGFYHETPIYYITSYLVPDSIKKRLDAHRLLILKNRIEQAILHSHPVVEIESAPFDFDWKAAKQKVESILNEYGETLQNIQYPTIVQRFSAGGTSS